MVEFDQNGALDDLAEPLEHRRRQWAACFRSELDSQVGAIGPAVAAVGQHRSIAGEAEHVFHVRIRQPKDASRIVEEIGIFPVVRRDGLSLPVAGVGERGEGVAVQLDRAFVVALNVGDDAEVELHAAAQPVMAAAALQRAPERITRVLQLAGFERDAGEHVQGFGGEHVVAHAGGNVVTARAQLARRG